MNLAYEEYMSEVKENEKPVLDESASLFNENGTAAAPNSMLLQMKADRKLAVPTIEGEGFHIAEKDWYLLVRNIKSKVNTLMVGPSGTGKTELVLFLPSVAHACALLRDKRYPACMFQILC